MDAFISADELNGARVAGTPWQIVDARYYLPKHGINAHEEFLQARLPGAIFLDLSSDLAEVDSWLRNTWPKPEALAKTLAAKGLQREIPTVVYDRMGFSAPRVAWLLLQAGFDVTILNGGIEAWRRGGYELESGPSSVVSVIEPESLSASMNERLVSAETLKNHCKSIRSKELDPGVLVVDARNPARFSGVAGEPATGHIPGSTNLHYRELVSDTSVFLTGEELKNKLNEHGILNSRQIISTCGSGVTACILLWALRSLELDGCAAPQSLLFDGSFDEWHRDSDCPIARS